MIGQALVLFVFILSIHWDIWNKITSGDAFLLGLAFIIAFVNADEPIIKIVKYAKEKWVNG